MTDKKKSSKKVSKKVEKKVTPTAEVMQEAPVIAENFLTREEQLALEDALNSSHKARLAVQVAEGRVQNVTLEKQILANAHDKQMREADQKINDAQNALNTSRTEAQTRAKRAGEIINSIKTKYGVAGDLQYDPVSGKIK